MEAVRTDGKGGRSVERPASPLAGEGGSRGATRDTVVFVSVLLVLVLAASVFTLTGFPVIHVDEPWYANLAQNWLTTGNRWTTLDVGPGPEGRGAGTTLLGALPTRVAVQLGGLNLRAIRVPSLVAGIVLLAVAAATGRALWSVQAGALAALVLALQPLFLHGSHLARPEIWLTLVVMLALGCSVVGWKRKQPLWDAAAALLAVLSLEIHQNGAAFAIGLTVTYLARYGRRVLRQPGARAFLGIGLLGAAAYVLRTFGWLLPGLGGVGVPTGGGAHSIPVLSANPLVWLLNEAARYALYFGRDGIGALLLGFAVAAAVRRRTPDDRLLLWWLAGSVVGIMLLVSRRFELYLLPLISVATLLVGRGLAGLLRRPGAWVRRAVVFTLFVLMLPLLLIVGQAGMDSTAQLHEELGRVVPCGKIIGPNRYWLAFTECEYQAFDVISHYHHRQGHSYEEAMGAVRPDYLILDETLEPVLQDDFGEAGDMIGYFALPRADYEGFLDERATLVRLFTLPGYGTIQIWQVDWEAGA